MRNIYICALRFGSHSLHSHTHRSVGPLSLSRLRVSPPSLSLSLSHNDCSAAYPSPQLLSPPSLSHTRWLSLSLLPHRRCFRLPLSLSHTRHRWLSLLPHHRS
ncbi:hypothetical protein CsSME_00033319 [Camellia sinensis var. sinensis]